MHVKGEVGDLKPGCPGREVFLHLFGQMLRRKLFRKKLQTRRFLHYASATNKYSSAQIERETYQPFLIAVPGDQVVPQGKKLR